MSSTKIDIINKAYEDIRISGITLTQGASGNVLGLDRLEDMMNYYFEAANMDVGYNFEETPDLNSPTGVIRAHNPMMSQNLAMRLISAYGKDVPPALAVQAAGAMNGSLTIVARSNTRPVQPSRRMPRGSGNEIKQPSWVRYMRPLALPATVPGINKLYSGETEDYTLDVSAWLEGNTIASIALLGDPRVTIDSSSFSAGTVTYTITATDSDVEGSDVWQLVQITVTDSAGRVNIWLVNFEVVQPPEVG